MIRTKLVFLAFSPLDFAFSHSASSASFTDTIIPYGEKILSGSSKWSAVIVPSKEVNFHFPGTLSFLLAHGHQLGHVSIPDIITMA